MFAFVVVGEGYDRAVMLGAADAAVAVLAAHQPAFAVAVVAVGVACGLPEDRDAVRVRVAQHAVVGDVAPQQVVALREIDGTFRPLHASEVLDQLGVVGDHRGEAVVVDFEAFSLCGHIV